MASLPAAQRSPSASIEDALRFGSKELAISGCTQDAWQMPSFCH